MRGRNSERPAHRDEEWPPFAATRESPHRNEDPTQPKINKLINLKKKQYLEHSRHTYIYVCVCVCVCLLLLLVLLLFPGLNPPASVIRTLMMDVHITLVNFFFKILFFDVDHF